MTTEQSTADRVYILTGSWVWDRMYLPGDEVHFTAEQEAHFLAKMPKAFRKKDADSDAAATETDAAATETDATETDAAQTPDAPAVGVIDALEGEALDEDADAGTNPAQPAGSEPSHA